LGAAARRSLSLAGTLALAGSVALGGGACSSEGAEETQTIPYRQDWTLEALVDFPYLDAEGAAQITELTVGGRVDEDNFASRGDVIVEFSDELNTGGTNNGPRIRVELRRFTFATSESDAQLDFDRLQLWAFTGTVEPTPDKDAEDSCVASAWQNDCEIRVWYDGLTQPARLGADIRVTLPSIYRHELNISTEDALGEGAWLNRGNVCVDNLNGTADITLGSGEAFVRLADATTPVPVCPQAQVDACVNFTDPVTMEPAAWAAECPCIANFGLGRVQGKSLGSAAANMTVQVPANLWSSFFLRNTGDNVGDEPEPCTAIVDDRPNLVPEPTDNTWTARAESNRPSARAPAFSGFFIDLESLNCAPVRYSEDPEDFVPGALAEEQASEQRGNLRACTDCLTGLTCEQLLAQGSSN
jgi:hypothetical protein